MNALDNEREGRATDVLLNYETVRSMPTRLPAGWASCIGQRATAEPGEHERAHVRAQARLHTCGPPPPGGTATLGAAA